MKKIIFRLSITIVILACTPHDRETVESDSGQEPEMNQDDYEEGNSDTSDFNLLFIGNSLTYSNNLPSLVRSHALTQGVEISVTSITRGNYALVDHWKDGTIQSRIDSKKFDFVIVQQGPSSQAYGRDLLLTYGGYISELCKNNNAKLAYFMVWPALTYYDTFDGVIESYRLAATTNNDILCPVGEIWKSHFDETGDFSYYGADGFHPSLKGSKVAAQIIFKSLFSD